MNYTDHYRENNKLLGIMKHQLGREIREDFSALGAKRYSFLKMIIMKIKSKKTKIKLEDYKNCLEVTQLENEVNHLEKNDIVVNSLKKNH